MKQLHEIQIKILQKLLFSTSLRYSQLKPDKEMENNQFQFHLDQLIAAGLVYQEGRNYGLSPKGKELANRIDENEMKLKLQAKISAWVACTRTIEGQRQFLIYTRLKHPFFGCQGYLSGKVRYGEKISEAVKRELKEETNLECDSSEIVAIKHYRVFDKKSSELVEDKFMFLCVVSEPKGQLRSNEEGKFEWVNEDALGEFVTNPFESKTAFWHEIDLVRNFEGKVKIFEEDHVSEKF